MSAHTIPIAVIRLGRIVATPHVLASITEQDILMGIQRHQAGDWGDVSAEDREANNRALTEGTRILSAYQAGNGTKFWIITEADRSSTAVLLPGDY
jgi:hypothetical protein